jgi:hypothetical protein
MAPRTTFTRSAGTRALPPLIATVLVVEFEAPLHDPASVRWRETVSVGGNDTTALCP